MNDPQLAELLTLTVEVNQNGSTIYRNQQGKIHRVLGPAVINRRGDKFWYINGQSHRLDGPGAEWIDGTNWWYLFGVRMTEDEYYKQLRSIKSSKVLVEFLCL